MRLALQRIAKQTIILKTIERPTPFAFPIMVDSLGRERLTTEPLEERIAKMARQYEVEEEVGKLGSRNPDSYRGRKTGVVKKRGL